MSPQANAATILLQQALALHQKGQLAPAEELYKKALVKSPEHFETNYLYGMLKLHKEDWSGAREQLARAVELNASHVDTYFDLATALQHLERHDEAAAVLEKAVARKPDFADALLQLGNSYRKGGHSRRAIDNYRAALELEGAHAAEAWFQLGNAQHDAEELQQAINSYGKAIALRPDFIEALFNLANTQKDTEQLDAALATYDRLLALAPEFAPALTNRGYVLFLLKRSQDALDSYDRAAALDDASSELWFNRGSTLEDLQRFDEAIASYQRAQTLDPDGASPFWNESLTRLLLGDFEHGWRQYEWRWNTEQMRDFQRGFIQPLWLGEQDIRGKTILLHAEQGYGDTLQFSRYVPILAARGARVVLEVPASLCALMAMLPGVAEVVTPTDFPRPQFDLHCPLMSLPLACGTLTDSDIPRAPYLTAEPRKWGEWYQRLPQTRALRVGLVWSGNPRVHNAAATRIDSMRSVSFDTLAPIVELARDQGGVEFYSLQVGDKAVAQLQAHPLGSLVTDHSALLRDFSETAGLVANLDLVISVDTAVCHLAGALGKPVWLLNRFNTCWRWQLDRTDTPWYPNFTIFRQAVPGQWDDVIAEMREALSQHLAAG